MRRNRRPVVIGSLTALLLATLPAAAADPAWTQWRGPLGTGYAPDGAPPLEWSATKNVRWKTAIPGSGHASPIVAGGRIYLMTAVPIEGDAGGEPGPAGGGAAPTISMDAAPPPPPAPGRGDRGRGRGQPDQPDKPLAFQVLALDRADGRVAWATTVCRQVPHEGAHATATFASGSPVSDGTHVYAFFGSRGLYCLDRQGNVVWERDLGDMQTRNSFGEGASPALHGQTLVVPWDHEGESFVAAIDARSGKEQWRVTRNEHTTWTTPVVVEVKGKPQAIVAGTEASVAYDLQDGRELWRCTGMTRNVIPTPVVGHGMVYLISGFRGAALQAVRLDQASGDISGGPALAWTLDRGTPYVPSPLLAGDRLYFLSGNNGIISCVDARSGAPHYQAERLEDVRTVYASIVGAPGRVYVCSREGMVVVLDDGPALKVLARNEMGEGIDASPAIVGREILIRGSRNLYCIAEAPPG
jgi:outer membrane protein assembly factor BamB